MIPGSIARIEAEAFLNCKNLKHIELLACKCEIGIDAFAGCDCIQTAGPLDGNYDFEFGCKDCLPKHIFQNMKNLTSVVVPEGISLIGAYSFSGCSELRKVQLPSTIRSVAEDAFNGCCALTDFELPAGFTDLDQLTMHGCQALADKAGYVVLRTSLVGYVGDGEELVIPEKVTRISREVFCGRNSSKIRRVKIPEGVTYLGKEAFADCENLEDVELPESLSVIESRAFFRCRRLSRVKLPKELRLLGAGAFQGCSYLKKCEIPKNVTTIRESVFQDCPSLTLVLPETVAVVEKNAFLLCYNVTALGKPADGVKKAIEAYKNHQAIIEKEKNSWLPGGYNYVPEGMLEVFYNSHASELSREDYYSLLNGMDSSIYSSSGEDDDIRLWLESEDKLEFRARDEHFVWHDETVLECCAIQLSLERKAPSGVEWEAPSTKSRIPCRIRCKGLVLLSDKSSKSGDNWSYCDITDCQYLLLEPYGMQGVWKLDIYIKRAR